MFAAFYRTLLLAIVTLLIGFGLFSFNPAWAATPSPVPTGIRPATRGQCDPTFQDPTKPQCLQSLGVVFRNILNVVMGLAGFAAFVFLIIGGFKYLTSQGDPKALGSARTTITWALGGLVMIVVSYLIILIISNYTGVRQIEKFQIPTPAAGGGTP